MALATFSTFDTGKQPSKKSEPERFYHGFVLGLLVAVSYTHLDVYKRQIMNIEDMLEINDCPLCDGGALLEEECGCGYYVMCLECG